MTVTKAHLHTIIKPLKRKPVKSSPQSYSDSSDQSSHSSQQNPTPNHQQVSLILDFDYEMRIIEAKKEQEHYQHEVHMQDPMGTKEPRRLEKYEKLAENILEAEKRRREIHVGIGYADLEIGLDGRQ